MTISSIQIYINHKLAPMALVERATFNYFRDLSTPRVRAKILVLKMPH